MRQWLMLTIYIGTVSAIRLVCAALWLKLKIQSTRLSYDDRKTMENLSCEGECHGDALSSAVGNDDGYLQPFRSTHAPTLEV